MKKRQTISRNAVEPNEKLEDFFRAGLISKRTYDRLFDKQLETTVLERIKTADTSKFITHEELKVNLGFKD